MDYTKYKIYFYRLFKGYLKFLDISFQMDGINIY